MKAASVDYQGVERHSYKEDKRKKRTGGGGDKRVGEY